MARKRARRKAGTRGASRKRVTRTRRSAGARAKRAVRRARPSKAAASRAKAKRPARKGAARRPAARGTRPAQQPAASAETQVPLGGYTPQPMPPLEPMRHDPWDRPVEHREDAGIEDEEDEEPL